MRLYFAGLHIGWHEVWRHETPSRILLSFHYHTDLAKTLAHCKNTGCHENIDLILDSGAFSAWSKGAFINKEKYLRCAENIRDNFRFRSFYAVNLDVIPGKKGTKITRQQSEESMLAGWENYKWFKARGLDTIHVYHQGEDENFLLNTIIKECGYIGVSPSNDSSSPQKMMWCERTFHLLPEHIKTHGFAVTSPSLIKRFPWYSVDSASWCISAGMGRVSTSLGVLYFSTKGTSKEYMDDCIALKDISDDYLLKEFQAYGVKFTDEKNWKAQLKSDHRLRRLINYCYYKKLGFEEETREKSKKFVNPQLSFF